MMDSDVRERIDQAQKARIHLIFMCGMSANAAAHLVQTASTRQLEEWASEGKKQIRAFCDFLVREMDAADHKRRAGDAS